MSVDTAGRKNLVLDLDGTLIDVQSAAGANSALVLGRGAPTHTCGREFGHLRIYKRPGLDAFLTTCFDNFDNVAIWTLSTREWLDEVLDNVLDQFPREMWSFLWTGDRATRLNAPKKKDNALTIGGVGVVKDLTKIYQNKRLRARGFTRWNTIIVEDNPCNCTRNYGNAIYTYLRTTILPGHNVRAIEKRSWLRDMVAEEEKCSKAVKNKSESTTAFWMQPDKWKAPTIVTITTRSFGI